MAGSGVRVVRNESAVKVALIALTCGVVIGWIDTRPSWDDTGVTAGLILLAIAALVFLRPKYWWLTSPCVVAPVIALNLFKPASLVTEMHEEFPVPAARDYRPVFEVGVSPGEGIPIVEAVPQLLPLRQAPSLAARIVDTIATARLKRLEFDSARYQTIEAAPLTVRAPATIRGRMIGPVQFLSRRDYYRGLFRDSVVPVSPRDRVEYLQPRAEGNCFVRVAGDVIEANPCPTHDTIHFSIRTNPVTRWWIHVRTPTASGWLILSDTTARVVRRTL